MTSFARQARGFSRNSTSTSRLHRRPTLECLEDRQVPASAFVVPLTAAVDASHFRTLAEACVAAGASGIVTVESGTESSFGSR